MTAPTKAKITTEDATANFLFRRIQANSDYQNWADEHEVPDYITDNLAKDKKLRPYQAEAIKTFIWLYDRDRTAARHLLFNMATGTGKTLVMACCVLFLYTRGYRNFVFTVGRENIIRQAQKNLSDYNFSKYLFNRDGIRINGQRVNVNVINNPADGNDQDINFTFLIINTLYNRLREPHENQLSMDDFRDNKVVIIADEAHHLNVDTRSKKKSEAEEAENWETVVNSAVHANTDNMLLEFTATVDLKNDNIRQKYQDKLIYRYSFLEFNKDGYSKSVQFLYNQETQIEDQKRLLIVNAVALSEFRRLFAERTMKVDIKPIVLVKLVKIKESEKDREFFDKVISTLSVDDLHWLRDVAVANRDPHHYHEYEIVADMFSWICSDRSGLMPTDKWNDKEGALQNFVNQIKMSFVHDNTLIYNSQKKENPELLTQLDNPRNNIRVIFSVNALNEGWDVLSLYDIIHFDISENKKVSLQDIQLIGRGARYYPYKLPRTYRRDRDHGMFASLNLNRATEVDKRKFDNDPNDTGRALETMVYHFVKTGMFMENLRRDLLGQGIINNGVETRTITLKPKFMASETYQKGVVLVNEEVYRKKVSNEEIDTTFNQPIIATSYRIQAADMSDRAWNVAEASHLSTTIKITSEYFDRAIIEKALIRAENNFFRFNNLRRHLPQIQSVDDLIDKYLPMYEITYRYEAGKEIENLSPREKLRLLVNAILPEVRRKIDLNLPHRIGSREFTPRPLAEVFERQKTIYLAAFPVDDPSGNGKKVYISPDERAQAQTTDEHLAYRYDVANSEWYAYSENYGTSEEKLMVKWLAGQMPQLHARYPGCEIYLVRNELDYFIYSQRDGRRFSPDYLLFINDVQNHELYYQVIIEPKGSHLLLKDEWKERLLLDLSNPKRDDVSDGFMVAEDNAAMRRLRNNGYKVVRPVGLPLYNHEGDQFDKFAREFGRLV